jgi:hypothetical protein
VSVQTLLYNTYLQIISGGSQPFVGPLDDYTTGLSVALLPFRGFASYVDAGWRLRDDGDSDAEQAVEFDATTGDPVAPVLVGNGGMRWWYDQSGNARHLPQATASLQPYWTPNIVNGYPVARLDATDDIMTNSWSSDTATARTLYVVCRKRSAADAATYRPVVQIGSSSVACVDCNATSAFGWFANESFGRGPLGGTVTNWTLLAIKFTDASTAQAWANNTAESAFDPRVEYQANGFTLGGTINAYADADVAAALLYDSAHDDITRQAIQTILADKFGITLA